jgi:hypothetical protein
MFFQATLLAGYYYAHRLTLISDRRRQLWIHGAIVVAALLLLPIGIPGERSLF